MARKRRENAIEPPGEIKVRGSFTRAKKCMKTNDEKLHESGKLHRGKCDGFSGGRDENSSLLDSAEAETPKDQRRLTHVKDPAQELPVLDLHSGKALQPFGKMKLQLFPIDDRTREGLEKSGFHPYLELTLSSRKKISSVLKHLNSKWGSSKIACGEPVLYPYDKQANSACHKWTVDSNSITAGDVYAAIETPSVFRLRYGWSYETENITSESPSLSTFCTACVQSEGIQKPSSSKAESARLMEEQIAIGATSFIGPSSEDKEVNPTVSEKIPPDGQIQSKDGNMNECSGPTLFPWDDGLTNLSIGGLLSEVSSKGRFGNCAKSSGGGNATLWDDNLTNISIGGLLSEASLQGRSNNRELKSNGNDDNQPNMSVGGLLSDASLQGRFNEHDKTWNTSGTSMHPSPLISDSFDAFLNGRTDQPRGPCPAPPEPCSSILDGEDTCHAFSFANFSSSKGAAIGGGDVKSTIWNTFPDGVESVTVTKTDQALNAQTEGMQEQAQQEPKKHLLLSSQVFNQDSSLGLSGIKWADSLGPFDLGSSLSRKLINGDSISFSAIVKNI